MKKKAILLGIVIIILIICIILLLCSPKTKEYICNKLPTEDAPYASQGIITMKGDKLEKYEIILDYDYDDAETYKEKCDKLKTESKKAKNYSYTVECDPEFETIHVERLYEIEKIDTKDLKNLTGALSFLKGDGTYDLEGWQSACINAGYVCE